MKYGFIGCGNMAKAMISGMIESGFSNQEDMIVSNRSMPALEGLKRVCTNINVTLDNCQVAKTSDVLVLSVKPQVYKTVIEQIKDDVNENTLVVTIAPGYTLSKLKELFGKEVKIVRCMPNTPAMVGQGMTAFVPNENCEESDVDLIQKMLASFGQCAKVTESQMPAVTAISGSSPAYVFMFIEAMADGAVQQGLPRDVAYAFASQAVLGSAKMVQDTRLHPGQLKDMVCSPAGTTIEAVKVLEQEGFRASVIDAVIACAEKSKG